MKKIKVDNKEIVIVQQSGQDYISLTDMAKSKDEAIIITKWLSGKYTIMFLGAWETLNNPNFNYTEFGIIRDGSGTPSYVLSVKQWIERTNAIGIMAKTGRYGGTYAHKDIAFEFGTWISPEFKLLLIREFQRLKDEESRLKNTEWDYRRFLCKVNYRVHTDAIKENIIPVYTHISKEQEGYIYANEAEMLNMAIFGKTSKHWREENTKDALEGRNIRDLANVLQLTVLSNLENYNSIMIRNGVSSKERFEMLKKEAVIQLKALSNYSYTYPIESPYTAQKNQNSTFDSTLRGILDVPKPS